MLHKILSWKSMCTDKYNIIDVIAGQKVTCTWTQAQRKQRVTLRSGCWPRKDFKEGGGSPEACGRTREVSPVKYRRQNRDGTIQAAPGRVRIAPHASSVPTGQLGKLRPPSALRGPRAGHQCLYRVMALRELHTGSCSVLRATLGCGFSYCCFTREKA